MSCAVHQHEYLIMSNIHSKLLMWIFLVAMAQITKCAHGISAYCICCVQLACDYEWQNNIVKENHLNETQKATGWLSMATLAIVYYLNQKPNVRCSTFVCWSNIGNRPCFNVVLDIHAQWEKKETHTMNT